jgi:ABC-2 type transport system ATP-binding protein
VEEVCRRVLILSGGRLVADGTPDELASAEGERLVVEVDGPEQARLADALAGLEGVSGAEALAPVRGGSARCALRVASRRAAAPALQQLATAEGWTLLELRHELATLEQIFLSRTRGGPAEEVA